MTTIVHQFCPHCGAKQLPQDEQPYPGTHAFSIKYECGSQIVHLVSGNYWEWERECTREVSADGK